MTISKTVLIIGAGRSGKAAFKLLQKHGISALLFDDYIKEYKILCDLSEVSAVVLSPGIDRSHALVKEALRLGIQVINELELAALFLPDYKMIGITGTNGKSTTTVMLESILQSAGIKAKACGNLGIPLSEIACCEEIFDHFLVELSSFQLETISKLKLDAAIILNITPDHLDRYSSVAQYRDAKLKIISLLKPEGLLVVNEQVGPVDYPCTYFSSAGPFEHIRQIILGEHNQENAFAASLIAKFLGLSDAQIINGLKSFKPLPHRCEEIGEYRGITYINDSKGTTVVAVMKALSMIKKPIHLLLGGIDKGEDFKALNRLNFPQIKDFYVFGQSKSKITQELSLSCSYPDLKSAVVEAEKRAMPGDVILLSPGCASYDQFDNYEHRGDTFRDIFKNSALRGL